MLDSLRLYVFEHLPPGQFLTAVLSNDLNGAIAHADDTRMAALKRIVQFVYNDLPSQCWGSKEKVDRWLRGTYS